MSALMVRKQNPLREVHALEGPWSRTMWASAEKV